jgi:hypothetical protein
VIKALKEKYDNGEDVNLAEIENPHVVAGLLMYILRHMEEPMIPFHLYDKLVALSTNGSDHEDEKERDMDSDGEDDSSVALNRTANFGRDDIPLPKLRAFVQCIPFENRLQFSKLVTFLDHVVLESDANEATLGSVVHVFTPLLCRPAGCSWMSPTHIKSLQATKRVLRMVISKGIEIFTNAVLQPPSPKMEGSNDADTKEDVETVSEMKDIPLAEEPTNHHASAASFETDVTMEAHIFHNLCIVDVMVEDLVSSVMFDRERESVYWPHVSFEQHDVKAQLSSPARARRGDAPRTFQSTRRQQVQHCRFLRGQIRDFEGTFEKKHGRSPKVSERAHMSAVYEQYKRQKRSIRDGAATQVLPSRDCSELLVLSHCSSWPTYVLLLPNWLASSLLSLKQPPPPPPPPLPPPDFYPPALKTSFLPPPPRSKPSSVGAASGNKAVAMGAA